MEQELERLREAHRLLEESNRRREKLEAVMRSKLESEIAQLRGMYSFSSAALLCCDWLQLRWTMAHWRGGWRGKIQWPAREDFTETAAESSHLFLISTPELTQK